MDLNNSFDFEELEKLKQKPRVPEETFSSLTDVYSITFSILLKSLPLVIPYLLLMAFLAAIVAAYNTMSFDFEIFWTAYGNEDNSYIMNSAKTIGNVALINLSFLILSLIMDNLFYSAIAGQAKGTVANKASLFGAILVRNLIPLFIAMLLKSLFIGIGLCLFIIPGVMFWLSMLFIEYVVIFEDKGFFGAWKRSSELMVGCKNSFFTFISVASFALIPILILKVFYNFEIEVAAFMKNGQFGLGFMIALIIELAKGFLYGIYFAGTCLFYMKRVRVLQNIELENKDGK